MPRERKNDYRRIASDIVRKTQNGNWKLYIIVAEGDKTEPRYFDALEKYYKENWERTNLIVQYIDRSDPSRSGTRSLEDTLSTFLENLSVEYQIQEYDELWIILDTDDYENRQKSLEDLYRKCQSERNYYWGLSNPCFEIWLILHLEDLETSIGKYLDISEPENCTIREYIQKCETRKRPKLCKEINHKIHQGKLQPYPERLMDMEKIRIAIERGKMLGCCDPLSPDFPEKIETIGTEVYKLIEKLFPTATG